ncbi:hypothetical protein K450DRAFT_246237 [Umbelopsis ramanniana AG]|uniref:SWIM-type domain-containing protein n=1 Tax=Umbelopsis ramanniana AG TaxID=1314678 RepID=A0AAD5E870_UMBRA|nr:uncharacterized protein K450DRAFT_246237 [Umbelopsis ramanniana AG]KAI8578532.1 hypothetical protein K450DRAFT_246237 [Umbelopsis ramanniana AG]
MSENMHTWDWVAPEVDGLRVNRSFSNVKLTKMERSALDMVNQMTWQEAERLVVPHNEQEVLVAAFGDDKVGSFAIRLQRNCMLDCTCMNGAVPNSRGRKKTCRHMFLVNRVLNKSFEWEQHVKRRLLPINQVILGSEPRKRFHDAYDITWEKAQLLIAGNHKDKIQVHSFTDYSTIYDIALEDEVMVSCTCPDDMSICKHMYIGQRVLNKLVTYERSFQNERHLTLKDILRMKEDKELDKKREAFQVWQQEAESLVELVRQRWGAANEASSSEENANDGEASATPQDKEIPEQEKEEEPLAKKRKLSHSEDIADGEVTDASSVNGDKKAAEKRAALESFRQQAEMLGNLARGQKIDDIVQTWGLQQINAIIGDLRKMKQMLGAL